MNQRNVFDVHPVNLSDPEMEKALRLVIQRAFADKDPLPMGFLRQKLDSQAALPSVMLAAFDGDRLVGCNAYVGVDGKMDGRKITGHLSCWTATDPDYQGKGVFGMIVNKAKVLLKEMGSGFIYGIGNEQSHPLLTQKHGFREIPAAFVRIPKWKWWRNRFFTNQGFERNQTLHLNEFQLAGYKQRQFPDVYLQLTAGESMIWGKLESRKKWGLTIRAFYVGGLIVAREQDLPELLNQVFKTYPVSVVQLTSGSTNPVNRLIRNWQPTPYLNGFIYYDLNLPMPKNWACMIGSIDVF